MLEMSKEQEIKKINRDALVAKLYTSREMLKEFSTDLRHADSSVELAFKLGEWKNTMLGVITELIKEVDELDE